MTDSVFVSYILIAEYVLVDGQAVSTESTGRGAGPSLAVFGDTAPMAGEVSDRGVAWADAIAAGTAAFSPVSGIHSEDALRDVLSDSEGEGR